MAALRFVGALDELLDELVAVAGRQKQQSRTDDTQKKREWFELIVVVRNVSALGGYITHQTNRSHWEVDSRNNGPKEN